MHYTPGTAFWAGWKWKNIVKQYMCLRRGNWRRNSTWTVKFNHHRASNLRMVLLHPLWRMFCRQSLISAHKFCPSQRVVSCTFFCSWVFAGTTAKRSKREKAKFLMRKKPLKSSKLQLTQPLLSWLPHHPHRFRALLLLSIFSSLASSITNSPIRPQLVWGVLDWCKRCRSKAKEKKKKKHEI